MIPLRDNIPSEKIPLLNYLIMAANMAVFFHELSLGEQIEGFVREWGLVPWNMTRGIVEDGFSPQKHVATWFSSMFLHGGWLHLIGNMWFLHIFGDNVEDRLGRVRFLAIYFAGGLLAGLAQVISSPGETTPMVGASGAISAVLGAYLVLYPKARVLTLVPIFIIFYTARLPAFVFIGAWFAIQVFLGYSSMSAGSQEVSVAWWAHIGGFAGGFLLAFLLKTGTVGRTPQQLPSGRFRLFGRGNQR